MSIKQIRKLNEMSKYGPFTCDSGGLQACWCIQWCIWASVSWSGAALFCCSPAAGSPEAGAKPLRGSSSASSPARWPSCVFWWTSLACLAFAPVVQSLLGSWRWSLWSPDAGWSSTSPVKSTLTLSVTQVKWAEVTLGFLQRRSHGTSTQTIFQL